MATASKKEVIKHFVNALHESNAAFFAGAGFSKGAGFVDWKELIRETATDLGLDVDQETDLIAIAQYHINERLGNRSMINQLIIDQFVREATLTTNHEIVAALPIQTFWTTNYDNLLETALVQANKTPDVKRVSENICITVPKRDAVIYKMHGDLQLPNEAVLTKEDYETYELNRGAYSLVLQADLVSKTFLFAGFSFDDPNLVYILSRIKNLLGTRNTRNHYCFFKKIDKNKATSQEIRRQELRLKDLNRYGISAVLVDDYPEITQILADIQRLYRRSLIFISGAAEVYDEFGTEEQSLSFVHQLSKAILSRQKKLISGFGQNIGSAVLNGALEFMFSTRYRDLDEYLRLMPFPRHFSGHVGGTEELKMLKKKRNEQYRELMINEAGIIIFVFGNRYDEKDTIKELNESRGMWEEFKIAKAKGLKPIPVGATGYAAKGIWQDVMDNFADYYADDNDIREWMKIIGDRTYNSEKLIETVNLIIDKLNRTYE